MTETMILVDKEVDVLWRRHFPAGRWVVEVGFSRGWQCTGGDKIAQKNVRYPHYSNFYGWLRWFRKRDIGCLYCYGISVRSVLILLAARLSGVRIVVAVTGVVDRICKYIDRMVSGYIIPVSVLAGDLRRLGVAGDKIRVGIVEISVDVEKEGGGGFRCLLDSSGPVLLALEYPDDRQGIMKAIWTGALLWHIDKRLKVVLVGDFDADMRSRIDYLQRIWNCAGMVYLHKRREDWCGWAAEADIVFSTDGGLGDSIIRLLYARGMGVPLVIPAGRVEELLIDYPQVHFVQAARPRLLASKMLSLLKSKDVESTVKLNVSG